MKILFAAPENAWGGFSGLIRWLGGEI